MENGSRYEEKEEGNARSTRAGNAPELMTEEKGCAEHEESLHKIYTERTLDPKEKVCHSKKHALTGLSLECRMDTIERICVFPKKVDGATAVVTCIRIEDDVVRDVEDKRENDARQHEEGQSAGDRPCFCHRSSVLP
jgi:hypothetical protein